MIALLHRGIRFECDTPHEALALADLLTPEAQIVVTRKVDAVVEKLLPGEVAEGRKRGRPPLAIAEDVEAYLREHPGARPREVRKALHIKAARLTLLVRWLQKSQRVVIEGNTNKRRLYCAGDQMRIAS